jgi:hypothetical protein
LSVSLSIRVVLLHGESFSIVLERTKNGTEIGTEKGYEGSEIHNSEGYHYGSDYVGSRQGWRSQ